MIGAFSGTVRTGRMASLSRDELAMEYQRRRDDPDVGYYYAYSLMQDGQSAQALQVIRDVVRQDPKSVRNLLGLARCTAANGDVMGTLDAYQKALALDPRCAGAHSETAAILAEAGLMTEAAREYDAAMKLNPAVSVDPVQQSRCFARVGRFAEAWNLLTKAINEHPGQDEAYLLLARICGKVDQYSEAERLILRRIDMTSVYPGNQFYYALAIVELARPRTATTLHDAQVWLQSATKGERARADYFALYAGVLLDTNRVDEAMKAAQAGLKLEPRNTDCLRVMATISERRHDGPAIAKWKSALWRATREDAEIDALRRDLTVKKDDPLLLRRLATALQGRGNSAEAAEICERLLTNTPADPALSELRNRCRATALLALKPKPGETGNWSFSP